MTSDFIIQLFQKTFLALLSSTIPIAFANFMVWKKKIPPSLFVRFPGWRHWARGPLVITTVPMQLCIFYVMETASLFKPELKLGSILFTVLASGILTAIAITLLYLMARNAFVPREEKDAWNFD
jgi:hypothetical protein